MALAHLLGTYLAFALVTTRWRLHGLDHLQPALRGQPVIAGFWHETLPLMPALWSRTRRRARPGTEMHVMVSRHRDGALIAAVMRRFHMRMIHGSSSRGGAAALRAACTALAACHQIAITPDGPRGPRRQAAPGIAQLAALSGAIILPVGAATTARRILPSWDRMILPLPFGRGILVVEPAITVGADGWQDALPGIEAAITRAADRAECLCREPTARA